MTIFSSCSTHWQIVCRTVLIIFLAVQPMAARAEDEDNAPPPGQITDTTQQAENTPTDIAKIVIRLDQRLLSLYEGEQLVKNYPVGVGKKGFSTPVGRFKVISKVINPGWEQPYLPPGRMRIMPGDKHNPLGTRWIGFKPGKAGGEYGIHGTDNTASVGKYSSHGCVRMRITDAEELFDAVSIGTPIIVIPGNAPTHKTTASRRCHHPAKSNLLASGRKPNP